MRGQLTWSVLYIIFHPYSYEGHGHLQGLVFPRGMGKGSRIQLSSGFVSHMQCLPDFMVIGIEFMRIISVRYHYLKQFNCVQIKD